MNTFGKHLTLTTFGESHGRSIGGIIDGFPPLIDIDIDFIQAELNRRRPGQSNLTTARQEKDKIEVLSGVFEGKSTGTPIAFEVRNEDQHSNDYKELKDVYRPSHADYTYDQKYGIRDYTGGGRSSARTTIAQVAGGAFAKLLLKKIGVQIHAYTSQVGSIKLSKHYSELDFDKIESNAVRCPDETTAAEMEDLIKQTKAEGDTVGGIITCVIQNCPTGLGEPQFDKLQGKLAEAMLSINACKGFEYGCGFEGVTKKGSELNDVFISQNGAIRTKTNNSGGIQGGISNGEDIYMRIAFKPVATLLREQQTIDLSGQPTTFTAQGRHDPCVLPRAVPIVEAMAAMTVLDHFLMAKTIKI